MVSIANPAIDSCGGNSAVMSAHVSVGSVLCGGSLTAWPTAPSVGPVLAGKMAAYGVFSRPLPVKQPIAIGLYSDPEPLSVARVAADLRQAAVGLGQYRTALGQAKSAMQQQMAAMAAAGEAGRTSLMAQQSQDWQETRHLIAATSGL